MLEIVKIEENLNYKFPNDYKEYMDNNNPLKFRNKAEVKIFLIL